MPSIEPKESEKNHKHPSHGESGAWYVYIVQCNDGSLYTGVTMDVERRLKEHNSADKGARYTRSRQPVRLAYVEYAQNRSAACHREYQVKRYGRKKKLALIGSSGVTP